MAIDQQPPVPQSFYDGRAWNPGSYGLYPPPVYVVPTSGMAVASLVCSLLGLVTGITAIAGVILGHLALPETRSGRRGGHGLAVAGLIIGWIQCGLWLLFWLFFLGLFGVALTI